MVVTAKCVCCSLGLDTSLSCGGLGHNHIVSRIVLDKSVDLIGRHLHCVHALDVPLDRAHVLELGSRMTVVHEAELRGNSFFAGRGG